MCSNNAIKEAILSGNVTEAGELTRQWLSSGRSAQEFHETMLSPAVEAIREQFARGASYLPEFLVSLRAARAALSAVDAAGGRKRLACGTIVVGSLARNGDRLCRDLIVSLLEVCGWNVVDLGGEVSPAQFGDACVETCASVLVIAELSLAPGRMSSKVPSRELASLVKEMEARGVRQRTGILIVRRAPDRLLQGPHEVDAICDHLAEIPPSIRRLVTNTRAESSSH